MLFLVVFTLENTHRCDVHTDVGVVSPKLQGSFPSTGSHKSVTDFVGEDVGTNIQSFLFHP